MPPRFEKGDRILTWNLVGIELRQPAACGRFNTIFFDYTIEPVEARSDLEWSVPKNSYPLHFEEDPVASPCSIRGLPPLAPPATATAPSNPPSACRWPPVRHGCRRTCFQTNVRRALPSPRG